MSEKDGERGKCTLTLVMICMVNGQSLDRRERVRERERETERETESETETDRRRQKERETMTTFNQCVIIKSCMKHIIVNKERRSVVCTNEKSTFL